jgi:hypothetical protein
MRRSQAPANDDGGTGMESASVPNQLERPDKQRTNKGWPRACLHANCQASQNKAKQRVAPAYFKGGPGFTHRSPVPTRGGPRSPKLGRPTRGGPRSEQTKGGPRSVNKGWPQVAVNQLERPDK